MSKILVVEVNNDVRENIVETLESEDYCVLATSNAIEALASLNDFKPDLILSEIVLPEMDGYEFLSEIIKIYNYSVTFIFITGNTDYTDWRKGMNLGADDYLTKPFSAKDLCNTIKTRLIIRSKIKRLK